MTDDNQPDAHQLPPEEFDVRGCRGAEGIPGDYCVDPATAPSMTADRARGLLDAAISAPQSLMVIEATLALRSAIQSAVAAGAYVAKHMATPTAGRVYAVESVDGPLNAAVLASIFGRHLDDEDVALATAAAALGSALGA